MLSEKTDMSTLLPMGDDPAEIMNFIKECLNYDALARPLFPDLSKRMIAVEENLKAHPEKDVWKNIEIQSTQVIKDTAYGEDVEEYERNEKETS